MARAAEAPPQGLAPARRVIDELLDDPRPPGCKALANHPGHYRVRFGDYRVIYLPRDDVLIVVVVDVGHRREVYR